VTNFGTFCTLHRSTEPVCSVYIKTDIIGPARPKNALREAWRIEFSYRNIHEHYARSKGQVREAFVNISIRKFNSPRLRMWVCHGVCACFVRTVKNAGSI
jgi:hypothetical protein